MINNNSFKNENEGKNPFAVPENYFEVLPEQITAKCKQAAQKYSYYTIRRITSYAAIFIIALTSSLFLTYYINNDKTELNDYAYENIMDEILYIADIYDIDDTYLIEYMTEEHIYKNSFDNDYEDIIEYIDDENTYSQEIIELIEY